MTLVTKMFGHSAAPSAQESASNVGPKEIGKLLASRNDKETARIMDALATMAMSESMETRNAARQAYATIYKAYVSSEIQQRQAGGQYRKNNVQDDALRRIIKHCQKKIVNLLKPSEAHMTRRQEQQITRKDLPRIPEFEIWLAFNSPWAVDRNNKAKKRYGTKGDVQTNLKQFMLSESRFGSKYVQVPDSEGNYKATENQIGFFDPLRIHDILKPEVEATHILPVEFLHTRDTVLEEVLFGLSSKQDMQQVNGTKVLPGDLDTRETQQTHEPQETLAARQTQGLKETRKTKEPRQTEETGKTEEAGRIDELQKAPESKEIQTAPELPETGRETTPLPREDVDDEPTRPHETLRNEQQVKNSGKSPQGNQVSREDSFGGGVNKREIETSLNGKTQKEVYFELNEVYSDDDESLWNNTLPSNLSEESQDSIQDELDEPKREISNIDTRSRSGSEPLNSVDSTGDKRVSVDTSLKVSRTPSTESPLESTPSTPPDSPSPVQEKRSWFARLFGRKAGGVAAPAPKKLSWWQRIANWFSRLFSRKP